MEENLQNSTGATEQEATGKMYTEAEVAELLQRESDRRVTSALKKQADKYEREKAESEKLSNMNEAQKKEYSLNKREEEIAAKEKELTLELNKIEAQKILAERGIPSSFVSYVVTENAEDTMKNSELFEQNWKDSIAAETQSRLAQPAPKTATATGGIDKESFKKMTLSQQAELYKSNPQLYKQLTAI